MTEFSTTDDVATTYTERTQNVIEPVAVAVVAAEPLRIVTHPTRDFTTGQVQVTAGQIQQVVGANPFRQCLRIVNAGGGPVYIGPQSDALTVGGGYWLGPGKELPINSRHAVYVLGDASLTGPNAVHFFAEFVDG
jgi:hypothetical protein